MKPRPTAGQAEMRVKLRYRVSRGASRQTRPGNWAQTTAPILTFAPSNFLILSLINSIFLSTVIFVLILTKLE